MPVITLSVEDVTRTRIQAIAKIKRQTLSAVVDTAIELLATQDEFSNLQPTTPRQSTIDAIPGLRKGATA